MPELPEVETIRRGIVPHFVHHKITNVIVRQRKLRWLIPADLPKKLLHQTLQEVTRRGKYLLFHVSRGTLIIHLGMSGKLLILPIKHEQQKHEHVIFEFSNHKALVFIDQRRFGSILWTEDNEPLQHNLLRDLGVEPLEREFNINYLWKKICSHKATIKQVIMNSHVVVGVGNIYAAEALFLAGIRPDRAANSLTCQETLRLVRAIKQVLRASIKNGGTTFRDYAKSDGSIGEFVRRLNVYGREGQDCLKCGRRLHSKRIGQRSTVFCEYCQR